MKERTWYIAEPSSPLRGPYTTSEVRAEVERGLPDRTLLFPSGEGPVFSHDTDGLNTLMSGGTLQERLDSVSVPHVVAASVFLAEVEFSLASTKDWDAARNALSGEGGAGNLGNPSPAAEEGCGILRFLKHLFLGRFMGILLLGGGLGLAAKVGIEGISPETRAALGLELSLSAAAPTSLKVLDAIVGARLGRDVRAYARALVHAESSRSFFSAEQLPSSSWVAAIAMTTLPAQELDLNPFWRGLLVSLGKETREGIAVAGYEVSRLEGAAARLMMGLSQNGISEKKARSSARMSQAWHMKPTSGGIVTSLEDVAVAKDALERLERVWDSVEEPHRLLRGRLVARALWATLPLGLAADKAGWDLLRPVLASTGKRLVARISNPDKKILEISFDELLRDARPDVTRRWREVEALQEKMGFLCNPNEAVLVSDFILQTASLSGAKGIPRNLFEQVLEECLVGAQGFVPLFPASGFEARVAPSLGLFLPQGFVSPFARTAFMEASLWQGEILGAKGFTARGAFLLWGALGGVLPPTPPLDFELQKSLCHKELLPNKTCLNIRWHYSGYADQKSRILAALAEAFPMKEVRDAALVLAADLLIGKIQLSDARAEGESLRTVRQEIWRYLDVSQPELSALEWYEANHAALAP